MVSIPALTASLRDEGHTLSLAYLMHMPLILLSVEFYT